MEGWVWGEGMGERCELHHRGPGQSPGRESILSIFYGHRAAVVEGKCNRGP